MYSSQYKNFQVIKVNYIIAIVGASLRESHYGTSVIRTLPYIKPIGHIKYLAMISPCQEKSIENHVDVYDRDQASQLQNRPLLSCYLENGL